MASYSSLVSDGIGLLIAALYTFAGQAHFTDRLTPDMAAHVEVMTRACHPAFWFLRMDYPTLKRTLGALDLLAAALLLRKKTRKAGLIAAVIGFSGGLYGQLYSGEDIWQVAGFLGLAVVGLLLAP